MNDMHEISDDPSLIRNVYRIRGVVRDILGELDGARKNAETIRAFARAAVEVMLEDFEAAAERAAVARKEMPYAHDRCSRCHEDSSVVLGDEPLCGRCYGYAMQRLASG